MISELDLADVIAFAVKAATAPLVAELAALKAAQSAPVLAVDEAVAALEVRIGALEQREPVAGPAGPPGLDGKDGAPGEQGPPGPPGMAGEKGLDGAEGKPGRDGRDGLVGPQGEKGLDGRDGIDGKDGVDGMGFDDLQVEHDGERAFAIKFVQGDRVKTLGTFTIPCVIYRGVYQSGRAYEKGDSVTWAGSQWIASAPTTSKPGESGQDSRAWTLATKKGTDGRNGKDAPTLATVKG